MVSTKTSILCILAALISSSITYYAVTYKDAAHAKYGSAVVDYINDCAGTHITEVYIEKGEKVYSIRCEEAAGEAQEDIYI